MKSRYLGFRIAKIIGDKSGITPEAVELALKGFLEYLEKEVIKKKEFPLHNFGKFVIKRYKEKKGRISKRGKIKIEPQEIIIPAHYVVKFIPCKRLKRKVNP